MEKKEAMGAHRELESAEEMGLTVWQSTCQGDTPWFSFTF